MTAISKYVYIYKLNYIVKEYNNSYHISVRMKPIDIKDNTYIDFRNKLIVKILNLKLVIM